MEGYAPFPLGYAYYHHLPVKHTRGTAPTSVDSLTCPTISYPFRCEDRALLRGSDPCPDRIRRSFAFRAVARVRAGKPITTAATELGTSAGALHNWARQDQIDRGERPGIETTRTRHWRKPTSIRQLEAEVEILRKAAKLLGEDRPTPKGFTR